MTPRHESVVVAATAARARRVLGLDPGSERFGYGVIDVGAAGASGGSAAPAGAGALVYVAAGVLTVPGGWPKFRRLGELGREVGLILDEYLPTEVALEAGFVFGQMGALTLGAMRGIAAYLAVSRGLPVFEYAPAAVKKAVTGNGRSDKAAVARLVVARLGMKRTPMPDAADALAVAITHTVQAVPAPPSAA